MRYRKKQIVIEAVKWTGRNFEEVWRFTGAENCFNDNLQPNELFIRTLEGSLRANKGDFIIKGIKGEFYPCKPDIFKATYESLKDSK